MPKGRGYSPQVVLLVGRQGVWRRLLMVDNIGLCGDATKLEAILLLFLNAPPVSTGSYLCVAKSCIPLVKTAPGGRTQ